MLVWLPTHLGEEARAGRALVAVDAYPARVYVVDCDACSFVRYKLIDRGLPVFAGDRAVKHNAGVIKLFANHICHLVVDRKHHKLLICVLKEVGNPLLHGGCLKLRRKPLQIPHPHNCLRP